MSFEGRMLSNVNVLVAIVESGSFARAADTLGLTPSGVSRAIQRLESQIGIRLFDRTTRSVTLTDEGRRLYEGISPLLDGLDEAITTAADSSVAVRGRLRVNVDAVFSSLILAPHIDRFLDRYPELSMELVPRDQLGDIVADGFDIAVRFGEPPTSSLVAKKLMETRVATVATPAYLRAHGHPVTPDDLAHHACIQVRSHMTGQILEWRYRQQRKLVSFKTAGRLVVSDAATLLTACLAGTGIARIKRTGVADLIDKGQLVELFPDWQGEDYPLYALYPSRNLPPAKVRAFIEFVEEIVNGQASAKAKTAFRKLDAKTA